MDYYLHGGGVLYCIVLPAVTFHCMSAATTMIKGFASDYGQPLL